MFITNETFRHQMPVLFESNHESNWTKVELGMGQIWFIATLLETEVIGNETEEFRRTLFLIDFKQVQRLLLDQKTSNSTVLKVDIVTPGFLNESDGWKIDRLSKVWVATEPDEPEQQEVIYETNVGKKFSCSLLETRTEDLVIKFLLAELPNISHGLN